MRHSSDMLAWYTFKQHDQEQHEHSENIVLNVVDFENLQFYPFVLSLSWWWTRFIWFWSSSEGSLLLFFSTRKVNTQQSKCKCVVIPIKKYETLKCYLLKCFFLFWTIKTQLKNKTLNIKCKSFNKCTGTDWKSRAAYQILHRKIYSSLFSFLAPFSVRLTFDPPTPPPPPTKK